MAGGFTTLCDNGLLNHLLKVASFSQPANLYVALYTVAPTAAGGGTEVSGSAYTRVVCNSWTTSTTGSSSNVSAISFPTPSGSWGTVVAFAILDASTSGNMLVYGTLTTSPAVGTGDVVQFLAGNLVINLA